MYTRQTSQYAATVGTKNANRYSIADNLVNWLEENEIDNCNTETRLEIKNDLDSPINVSTGSFDQRKS